MSKYKIIIIVVFLFTVSFYSCQQIHEKNNSDKTTIILVHPYLEDVNDLIYFIENNIIEIPNLQLLCIFYNRAKHDYEKISTLIENNNYPYIKLELIQSSINKKEIFNNNALSNKYHTLFKISDGILFFGGYDIQPFIYSQKTNFSTAIKNPHRHYFELSFLFHLLGGNQNDTFQPYLDENPNYIIQGYCLGMQTMNVATGGTLIQNIANEIYGLDYFEDVLKIERDKQHYCYYFALTNDRQLRINFHKIAFNPSELFVNEFKYDTSFHPYVYSNHKQSVKQLGNGFAIAATSMDRKVVEAIRHEKYKNVLGLQFHPEVGRLYQIVDKKYKFSPSDSNMVSFNSFLQEKNSLKFHIEYWKYFSNLFEK